MAPSGETSPILGSYNHQSKENYGWENCGRPKDVHVLKPGTCDCMILCDKGDFADMIDTKGFKMEKLAWISRLVQINLMNL